MSSTREKKMMKRMQTICILTAACIVGSVKSQDQDLEPDSMEDSRNISGVSQSSSTPISRLLEDSHNVIRIVELLLHDGIMGTEYSANVSDVCLNHTNMFLSALVERQQWALRSMLPYFI